jgi:hypothetical protein
VVTRRIMSKRKLANLTPGALGAGAFDHSAVATIAKEEKTLQGSKRQRQRKAPWVDPQSVALALALERKRKDLAMKKAERDLTDKQTQVNVQRGQVLLSSERIWIIEGVAKGRVSWHDELGGFHSSRSSVVNKMLASSALEPLDTSLRPIEITVRAKGIFNLEPKAYYLQPILQPAMDAYLEKNWKYCSCAGQTTLKPFDLGAFTPSSLEVKTFYRELSGFATAGMGTAPVPFYVGKMNKNGLYILPNSVTVKKGGALLRQYSEACRRSKTVFTLELESVFTVQFI